MTARTIKLPKRRVIRVTTPKNMSFYAVFEQEKGGPWHPVSKDYEHSTSAFAALGRLVQKDTLADE